MKNVMERIKENSKLAEKIAITSFVGFIGLSAVISSSASSMFGYYMKDALNYFILGAINVFLFSMTLGLVAGYLKSRYKKMWSDKVIWIMTALWMGNFYLLLAQTSFSIFSFTQMNGFLFTLANLVMTGAIIPMVSLMLVNIYKTFKNKEGSISSSGGFLAWVFSVGCPSCGAVLYSLLGVSSGLTLLPFDGLGLKALSLGLVAFSVNNLNPTKSKAKHKFSVAKRDPKQEKFDNTLIAVLLIAGAIMLFNQMQISAIAGALGTPSFLGIKNNQLSGTLSDVDISKLASTAATVSSVFPELSSAKSEDEIIDIMLPAGTPEYSNELGGITFDDPVNSLGYLAKWYYVVNEEVKQDSALWQRYLNLAAAPRGISCEYCCGVGPQGITATGQSRCGCQHNPALLAVTLGLMKNTDYSDTQILREVMRWKTLFFPKNMVAVGIDVAGKDPSQVSSAALPGMVGGC